ncbi:hypothetical protein DF185_08165 [Marinifilum breve]|uniref:Tail specific protease domain-containing protein n=1 Tax=Marinifilum breve TaxID=2184082 RepID=A0A2V4A297_9BACT|nr:S41 family peptidase [Marinifilum breve]PXY01450.1 hypothetical protein DF185_08165 [Marinifilum breve]
MRRFFLLLVIVVLNNSFTIAQQKISETEKIVSLGKIYGFLKYYHPEVGKGNFDWDKEFIKQLPRVINAKNKDVLSEIYCSWIDSLGAVRECKKGDKGEEYFDKNFDLSWLHNDSIFNEKLIEKLKYIEKNRFKGKNYYVTSELNGKIKVTNEPIYENIEFPSEDYRLLGLVKYWNIIEYFYPYKYLTDQNWNSVLAEMIPKFRNVSNVKDYQNTIRELIVKLDDGHAWVNFSDKWPLYLPVKVTSINNRIVISEYFNDSLANQNNLKIGDVVLKVNQIDIENIINEKMNYVSGSNKNQKRINACNAILRGESDSVTLTIERAGKVYDVNASRYNFKKFKYYKNRKVIKSREIHSDIGYLNMDFIEENDVAKVFKLFKAKKAIIIDLRNYPNFIYRSVSKQINSENRIFSKYYSPEITYPGRFKYSYLRTGSKNKKSYKGKVILLVNEKSVSRSEFTAMAFQTADNVITVGSQTAGADGDVVKFNYMGGYKTAITGNGVLYPKGEETQRVGVKVDVEVKPTIEGLREGRDEVLEKAIQLAKENINLSL